MIHQSFTRFVAIVRWSPEGFLTSSSNYRWQEVAQGDILAKCVSHDTTSTSSDFSATLGAPQTRWSMGGYRGYIQIRIGTLNNDSSEVFVDLFWKKIWETVVKWWKTSRDKIRVHFRRILPCYSTFALQSLYLGRQGWSGVFPLCPYITKKSNKTSFPSKNEVLTLHIFGPILFWN